MANARIRLVLGTGDFGRAKLSADAACHELIDGFRARGYNEIDTARMYTGGKSEQIIGNYLSAKGPVVATKINPWNPEGLSRASVLRQVESSLASLQRSSVDILYLHAPDHSTDVEETLEACQQLYKEGKFKELGVSNFASWEVVDAYHICKRNGWVVPTVYQGMYNPITRSVEGELFPALKHFGIRFYSYNPTAMGMLTGKHKTFDVGKVSEDEKEGRFFFSETWSPIYRQRYWRESVFKGLELIQKALDETYGVGKVSMLNATFRWMQHHSQLSPEKDDCIMLGSSTPEHIYANLDACQEGPLDPRIVKAFDEAWELDKANCVAYFR